MKYLLARYLHLNAAMLKSSSTEQFGNITKINLKSDCAVTRFSAVCEMN